MKRHNYELVEGFIEYSSRNLLVPYHFGRPYCYLPQWIMTLLDPDSVCQCLMTSSEHPLIQSVTSSTCSDDVIKDRSTHENLDRVVSLSTEEGRSTVYGNNIEQVSLYWNIL